MKLSELDPYLEDLTIVLNNHRSCRVMKRPSQYLAFISEHQPSVVTLASSLLELFDSPSFRAIFQQNELNEITFFYSTESGPWRFINFTHPPYSETTYGRSWDTSSFELAPVPKSFWELFKLINNPS